MGKIKVWTRQHRSVLETLQREGRYRARREFIRMDLQEHAELVLEVYDWLVRNCPDAANRPADVEYPVWVSFRRDATMLPDENTVILELELEETQITRVNIAKWGAMLNYSYLPADEADHKRHQKLLRDYGVSDVKAFMTRFYPEIKQEIMSSWPRLFDDGVQLGNDLCYGTIWEVKREWITAVID